MKYKKLIIGIIILVFLLKSFVFAEDNANIGSVGEGYGTTDFDFRKIGMWESQSNISIAKISLWDEETKEIVDSFVVSNYSSEDFGEEFRLMSKMSKPEYMKLNGQLNDKIKNSLEIEDEYTYLKKLIHIPDFPLILIRTDEGDVYGNVKKYFNDKNKILELLNSFSIDRDNNKNLILLIEPMGIFKVNEGTPDDPFSYRETETLILLTAAEIGLLSYNNHPIINCYVGEDEFNIMPFTSFYHTQIYQVIPFSCFKTKKEKLENIKPCNSRHMNSWTIHDNNGYLDMINSLGCFEVYSFIKGEEIKKEEEKEPRSADIEYYTNCYVITSVNVSSIKGFPYQSNSPRWAENSNGAKSNCLNKNLAKITFTFDSDEELNTDTYTQNISIPENGNALAWAKWKTPENPCNITINVSADSEDADLSANEINIEVIDPTNGKYPPNPEATDRNDGFIAPQIADGDWNIGNQKTLEWTTYEYNWHYDWHYICRNSNHGEECSYEISASEYNTYGSNGGYDYEEEETPSGKIKKTKVYWNICNACSCNYTDVGENHKHKICNFNKEDWGWVEWTPINHQVSINTDNEKLVRSKNSPNTNNSDYSIKSGYGIEFSIDTNCKYKKNGTTQNVSNIKDAICPPQYVEFFMPEFNYEEYEITSFNDLDDSYDDDNSFELPINPYSQFEQKCHFTPIWYPDGKYVVGVKIGQCFCPAGMLYICLDDISINIDGNAYDDWHIAPERN